MEVNGQHVEVEDYDVMSQDMVGCLYDVLQKSGELGVVISHTGVDGDFDVLVAVLVQCSVTLPDVAIGFLEVKPLS